MMDSCLMCLEINSIRLNCVRADSKRWQELNFLNTIEKHFWPLRTIQCNSWICSECWRMVDDFHKFYLRIEEAHLKLAIKLEKLDVIEFCEQKSTVDKIAGHDSNVKHEPIDSDENLGSVSGVKQIDSQQQPNCHKNEIKTTSVLKSRKRKQSKVVLDLKNTTAKIKTRLKDLYESDSGSGCDYDDININSLSNTDSSEYEDNCFENDLLSREEHDKIIADHFRQINCNVCKIPLENFFAVLKHFFEVHQQKGYILCCKTQFFNRAELVKHIRCECEFPHHFKCAQCDKIFSDSALFKEHKLRAHSSQEIAKRRTCGKFFQNNKDFKMYKLSHLPKEENKSSCQDCRKSNMLTECSNSSKGNLNNEYLAPETNSNCVCCQQVSKKLYTIEKQQNTLLESLAEQKVLLDRLVAQNSDTDTDTNMHLFPVNTVEQLKELDVLLNTHSYKRQIKSLINGNVERNLHHIFGQSIIMDFNVEGILGKQRLRDYGNVYIALIEIISMFNECPDKTLRTAFQRQKKKFLKQISRNKIKNIT